MMRFCANFRLKDHVEDPNKLPILIFPEGTCINNTSVMQFKKGSFEVGGTIYPVAIKYDPIFGDAFWNSSQNGMASYIFLMMTSWAIVCVMPCTSGSHFQPYVTVPGSPMGHTTNHGEEVWEGRTHQSSRELLVGTTIGA